jgi:hypothetical protein
MNSKYTDTGLYPVEESSTSALSHPIHSRYLSSGLSHVTPVSALAIALVCATDRSPVSILFFHSEEDCSLLFIFFFFRFYLEFRIDRNEPQTSTLFFLTKIVHVTIF